MHVGSVECTYTGGVLEEKVVVVNPGVEGVLSGRVVQTRRVPALMPGVKVSYYD
jgi:hypothetical protein